MTGKTIAGIILGAANFVVFLLAVIRGLEFTWPLVAVFVTLGALAGLLIDGERAVEIVKAANPFKRNGSGG